VNKSPAAGNKLRVQQRKKDLQQTKEKGIFYEVVLKFVKGKKARRSSGTRKKERGGEWKEHGYRAERGGAFPRQCGPSGRHSA